MKAYFGSIMDCGLKYPLSWAASWMQPLQPHRVEGTVRRRWPRIKGGACVITGPSGVGKSTLIRKLMEEFPDRFGFSVSHTTRDPRPGEKDGIDYHFVTKAEMEREIKFGSFIEYANVHGNLYGTSVKGVESVIKAGQVCLLDIDVQGATAVRKSDLKDISTYIFFAPPSLEVLESRLRGRGTETEERIQRRMNSARKELKQYEAEKDLWDLTLVNENAEEAFLHLRDFLTKQLP